MKVTNLKLFLAGVLVFGAISAYGVYQDYHLNKEPKVADKITQVAEDINFEDIFIPAEEQNSSQVRK